MENMRMSYVELAEDFAKNIDINHPGFCFYVYGSCFNQTNPETPSDLDGGLITKNIFTDKEEISEISEKLFSLSQKKGMDYSPLRFQFNLIDTVSGRDGRFLSYDSTYATFLKKYGKVLSG
ncbi:MAG: hypothetical protein ACOC1P_06030, partial [Minisyncoccales bacterium]